MYVYYHQVAVEVTVPLAYWCQIPAVNKKESPTHTQFQI